MVSENCLVKSGEGGGNPHIPDLVTRTLTSPDHKTHVSNCHISLLPFKMKVLYTVVSIQYFTNLPSSSHSLFYSTPRLYTSTTPQHRLSMSLMTSIHTTQNPNINISPHLSWLYIAFLSLLFEKPSSLGLQNAKLSWFSSSSSWAT